jgi:hypothetical protein
MRRILAFSLLAFAACRQQGLQELKGTLHLTPFVADFGTVYPGQTQTLTLHLRNDGPVATVKWTGPAAPFLLSEDLPTEAPSGEVDLTVRFAPASIGTFNATLEVEAEGMGTASVTLLGQARGIPDCPAPSACNGTSFDLDTGKCVEQPLTDGTSCAGTNVCLLQPTCLAGRCVGLEKSCDDANACTTDTCNAVSGCEHLPAPPCPGDGKCQVGVCDPLTGCGLERADDGTSCGVKQACDAAEVCIAGSCVIRDPPDGWVCAEASPCQAEGLCVADVCERPPAKALTATWSYDALTADAGMGRKAPLVHDLLLEPTGAVTLGGAFASTPQLRRNTPTTVEPAMGTASRCLLWNGKLICSRPDDALNAVDLATGATLWSFNLRTARPDFKVNNLFVGRMAVQSSDRLATLWEAYPARNDCRVYYLAILDASGGLVSAQELIDPLFNTCNHPHAYGFGADAAGHLFIAFAPTVKNPPLVSGTPTVVMSYSRDGVFRWKYSDVALKGGEIALARGLLHSEHGTTAVLSSTGQPAFSLAEKFGRATVTRDRLIPAPVSGATTLNAYESGTALARWKHTLAPGQQFASEQVRLASWSTRLGPQTVALTFTKANGKTQLHGIVARDGREAFTCDVAKVSRTAPQLFEVADGSLAVMDGALGCNDCEPAHADRSAAFHTLDVPLISRPAGEPWIGTYGGPGHDHKED